MTSIFINNIEYHKNKANKVINILKIKQIFRVKNF